MTSQSLAIRYAIRVLQVYHGSVVPETPRELAMLLREESNKGDRPDAEQALAALLKEFPEIAS